MILGRLVVALGLLLLPFGAPAQPAGKIHRVGVIMTTSRVSDLTGPEPAHSAVRAFVHGLRELGYVEGQKLLARLLAEARTAYAIIGGVALQIHQTEPRTTLDIHLAVRSFDDIPRAALEAAGFARTGRFTHSENWVGPDGTPVQFTDDPALAGATERAEEVPLDEVRLRVIRRVDLLHEKLRAAADPARRRSKRLQDLADAQALIESTPALAADLTAVERALLGRLPA